MNYYVSAVIHFVEDLQPTQNILTDVLEFTITEEGKGFAHLENGALCIRLIQNTDKAGQYLYLNVNSSDIDASIKLYQQHGFRQTGATHWAHSAREEAVMQLATASIYLIVAREYDEDELGIMPELKTSLLWHKEALLITQLLVKTIPINFRDIARTKIIAMAEADTIVSGQIEVDQPLAIQAIIKVTPDFQHDALKDEIIKNNLVIKDYFPDE